MLLLGGVFVLVLGLAHVQHLVPAFLWVCVVEELGRKAVYRKENRGGAEG